MRIVKNKGLRKLSNNLYRITSLSVDILRSCFGRVAIKINDLLTLSVVLTNIRRSLGGVRHLCRALSAAISSVTRVVNTGCTLLA